VWPHGRPCRQISDNDVLGALAFPRLKTVGGVGAVAVDVDKAGFFISGNAKLTKIDLPLLEVSGPIDPTTGAPVVSEDAGPREDPPITVRAQLCPDGMVTLTAGAALSGARRVGRSP
jgi:hypothetical protein